MNKLGQECLGAIYFCISSVIFIIFYFLLFFLVETHLAHFPHLVLGCGPPCVFPPLGWSQGFIAYPLTVGLIPSHRLAPAFPCFLSLWVLLDVFPIEA